MTLSLSQLCPREMCAPNVPQLCSNCAQTNFSLVCPEIVPQLFLNCASTVPQMLDYHVADINSKTKIMLQKWVDENSKTMLQN